MTPRFEYAVALAGSERQTVSAQGNLPSALYLELRTQALANSRLIAGPRLKNPAVASGGLDRTLITTLAEQRAYRLDRAGFTSRPASSTGLRSPGSPTLLASPVSPESSHRAKWTFEREAIDSRSLCPSPAMRAVNGRYESPVFTPVEPDNHYRIIGCGFGSTPGIVQLQPSPNAGPALAQRVILRLDGKKAWSDNHIDVRIDASLTGVPDFVADLVIQFANGGSVRMPHCQFVAARGAPQLLRSIPAAWVRLDPTPDSGRAIRRVEFESPPAAGEEIPQDAAGSSAFIARSDSRAFANGNDSFDLSQLTPGWVIESVQLRVFDAACPGQNRQPISSGSWETRWTSRGFIVEWADETCSSPIPPVFNFSFSSSRYATTIWVIGPVGTQPMPNSQANQL